MFGRRMFLIMATCFTVAIAAGGGLPTAHAAVQSPLAFTQNIGQWDDRVLFRASTDRVTMWFTKDGITYQFVRPVEEGDAGLDAAGPDSRFARKESDPGAVEQLTLTARLVGANPDPEVVGEGLLEYQCNFFIGDDPANWRTNVPNYQAITIKDIYFGIDLRFFDDGSGQAAYEFVFGPGADPAQIKVAYEGAVATAVEPDGQLTVQTAWGDLLPGTGISANARGLAAPRLLAGSADDDSPATGGLNGDGSKSGAPELVYSTYVGGTSDEWATTITVDGSGCAYITGKTYSSDYPTQSAYDSAYGGNWDVVVTKLSASGGSLVYSTFLGGSAEEVSSGITLDAGGNVYVTGFTHSADFPTRGAYDPTHNGDRDVYVTELSASGDSLIYSTFLGSSSHEWACGGIAVDPVGCIIVAGYTASSDFPTFNAFDDSFNGDRDVFVTKFDISRTSLVFSTFLGGVSDDRAYRIALDDSGSVYLCGLTMSSDFTTQNPFQTFQGYEDAIVAKFSGSGTLIYSTCLGGTGFDLGEAIAVDDSGCAYVVGYTESSDFPTKDPFQNDQNGTDGFVTKLSSTGDSLIYSTYFGGSGEDAVIGIAVDNHGRAHISGQTTSSDFPVLDPIYPYRGAFDAFVAELSASGTDLLYSTYLGGGNGDYGIYIQIFGIHAYVTGYTTSSDFPVLNAFDSTYNGGNDIFVTKLRHFSVGNADATINERAPDHPYGCLNDDLTVRNEYGCCPSPGWASDVLVRIDLSGLSADRVRSAKLKLWYNYWHDNNPADSHDTLKLFRTTADWDECTVTWNSRPSHAAEPTWCCPVPSTPGKWMTWDVTTDVKAMLRDSIPNYGWYILDDHYWGWPDIPNTHFCSREHGEAERRPQLEINGYVYGDANGDGSIDISDPVYLIAYIFAGGPPPIPLAAGDADCSGDVDISDAVYLITYIFSGGPAPCSCQ